MLRRFQRLVLLVVAYLLAPSVHAFDVAVVLSHNGGAYADFAKAFGAATTDSTHRVTLVGNLDDGIDATQLEHASVIIAVGVAAVEAVTQHERPTLGVLVARAQFDTLRQRFPQAKLSAILLDQPAERHLALMRALLPEAKRIGLLYGPESASQVTHFDGTLEAAGLTLAEQHVATVAELQPALERTLKTNDALLVLPDALVSGSASARSVLLTSYRYRRPVIAYSRAYVDAGALAAVFSTTSDIARDLADWLGGPHGQPLRLPPARPPRYFDIAINHQVARALNLDIEDEATVLERMLRGVQP